MLDSDWLLRVRSHLVKEKVLSANELADLYERIERQREEQDYSFRKIHGEIERISPEDRMLLILKSRHGSYLDLSDEKLRSRLTMLYYYH